MYVDVSRILFITLQVISRYKFRINADCLHQLLMSLLTLSAAFYMFLCYRGTQSVINSAASSHIKILISVRPQIICTLIFIPAHIRVNMRVTAVTAFSFFPSSFRPRETLQIHFMFFFFPLFSVLNRAFDWFYKHIYCSVLLPRYLHLAADIRCSFHLWFVLLQCVFLYTRQWPAPVRQRCRITGTPTSDLPSSSSVLSSSYPCRSRKKSASRSTRGMHSSSVVWVTSNFYVYDWTVSSWHQCVGDVGCNISVCGSDRQILPDGEPHGCNNAWAQSRVSNKVFNRFMHKLWQINSGLFSKSKLN